MSTLSEAAAPHRLSGGLGPGAIVFMVVAAAAPLTVIAGTVPLGISAGNGAAYPASYLVCTVILLFFAVGFTAMSRRVPGAGAFYTYITHGLGRHVGLGAAFLALLTYTRCRAPCTATSARRSTSSSRGTADRRCPGTCGRSR